MHYVFWALLSLFKLISPSLIAEEPQKIAEKAYIYGFPLVLMETTKNAMTNSDAPINTFFHKRTFPDASFTDVVSPNADTLYSTAWLDLSQEPIILSIPKMGDRYYLFPLLDEWSNVFFSPGTRTTGEEAQNYALVGPYWQGSIPDSIKVVKSPTNIVWIIGRIKTNGHKDYAAVHQLQDQFKLTPLKAWGETTKQIDSPHQTSVDSKIAPIAQVLDMDGVMFFNKLSQILKNTPIPSSDISYVKKFAEIGLVPGKDFDSQKLQVQVLNQAAKAAQNQLKEQIIHVPEASIENGWSIITQGIGSYGTNYNLRAEVALGGLGANLPEDAVYPNTHVDADGRALNGKFKYVIHFDKKDIPPVKAFWSISVYNDKHFFVENPINRYAIGDRDALKFNADGSLDIYLQNQSPGKEKEANWLPIPAGDFNLILRLYYPEKSVLDRTWKPPKVQKIS